MGMGKWKGLAGMERERKGHERSREREKGGDGNGIKGEGCVNDFR